MEKPIVYQSYILIVYTDEPGLDTDCIQELLRGYRFANRNLIDRAFLYLFFDPRCKTYPCIELDFSS